MMNSWQEWVVALLLLLCAVRIGMSIYSFFHRVKENGNPCDSCASGCELKNLYDMVFLPIFFHVKEFIIFCKIFFLTWFKLTL